jgi:hypothetical protein
MRVVIVTVALLAIPILPAGAARNTAAIDRSCPAGVLPSVQDGSGVR